ncbi:MAG: hypothetical protein CMF19_09825 [Idiomarinaceae bacterium]|nr:hypothetical protein [Idiomarinaceae bacterium]
MDDDKHYLRSRRMLIGISLVLLVTTMGGAQIYEINTFIFKLGFEHPENLFNILLWAAGFLLIRYYNNAAQYHKRIAKIWQQNLLTNNIYTENERFVGLIGSLAPDGVRVVPDRDGSPEPGTLDESFESSFLFFNCSFVFEYIDDKFNYQVVKKKVWQAKPVSNIPRLYFAIIKHWWDAQFRNNESLTLYGPYLIAFVAISYGICTKAVSTPGLLK